ncbi:MAG: hypothetical protein NZ561_05150, partial [Phycisphaerae bacterium]|nr:hypothetical protein [Phycisphaerae bacterium]MDW8263165.1 hypothetical protein [Phycisphaerales bacterium]
WAGLGTAILAAGVVGVLRRPSALAAAVAIDEKLRLKEKFSTALSMRSAKDDPFVAAAISDAERTAQQVSGSLRRHFPLRFPGIGYATISSVGLAIAAFLFLPAMDLVGVEARRVARQRQEAQIRQAEAQVKRALATVESAAASGQDLHAIQQARHELQTLLRQPIRDPGAAHRTALKALQDVEEAIREKIQKQAQFAQSRSPAKLLRNLTPDPTGQGPVADAHKALAGGDYATAAEHLRRLVENFSALDPQQQQSAIQQMQRMAQQLQQGIQNPDPHRQLLNTLQQLGASQEQALQMAQAMQRVAQGDAQSQKQLQQQVQELMQQLNNGQGPSQQQQQQIQGMLEQMQAQLGNQQTRQQVAEAFQQMAQAMQQSRQAMQQQGQHSTPQTASQQSQNHLQQAMAHLQQQLQQMEAAAMDARQLSALQQAMQEAIAEAAGNCPGGDADDQHASALRGRGESAAPQDAADPAGRETGTGGAGIGAGERAGKQPTPFAMKPEVSSSQNQENGRILASMLVKDNKPLKGNASAELRQIAAAAEQESAEEVDTERISRAAQRIVREYFATLSAEPSSPQQPQKP